MLDMTRQAGVRVVLAAGVADAVAAVSVPVEVAT
jgi:hypothetical protein